MSKKPPTPPKPNNTNPPPKPPQYPNEYPEMTHVPTAATVSIPVYWIPLCPVYMDENKNMVIPDFQCGKGANGQLYFRPRNWQECPPGTDKKGGNKIVKASKEVLDQLNKRAGIIGGNFNK